MVPKELLEIRFLQLFPDFVDLFIDARLDEADDNAQKSEEYRCKA
jgi:hypothetical protein